MKQHVDEERVAYNRAQTARQPMSDHTLRALCSAYARYLMQRTGISAGRLREHFREETGETPESDPGRFRKWCGGKCYLMDQLGQQPFAECA